MGKCFPEHSAYSNYMKLIGVMHALVTECCTGTLCLNLDNAIVIGQECLSHKMYNLKSHNIVKSFSCAETTMLTSYCILLTSYLPKCMSITRQSRSTGKFSVCFEHL